MSLYSSTGLPGIFERFHDGEGTKFHIERLQDVQPTLERNKALRNHDDGWNRTRDGRRIASIPMIVWYKWICEGMDPNDDKALRKKLNDPAWKNLRTSEGRV